MLSRKIKSIKVRNYRSLGDVNVDLSDLTVLVGANGTGKSNFLDVFRFVGDALTRGLDAALLAHDRGGIGRLRRYSSKGRPYDVEIDISLEIDGEEGHYGFVLGSKKRNEYEVKREECSLGNDAYSIQNGKVIEANIAETIATQERNLTLPLLGNLPQFSPLYDFLTQMGFYSIFPNDLRPPQQPGSSYPLETSGKNLASVLREITRDEDTTPQDLIKGLQSVIPSIDKGDDPIPIEVKQVGSYLVVRLRHENDAGIFDLALESDGTLRVLGLLTALYQTPFLPFIGLEEPELMVHPGAMADLCDIIEEAASRTQIILTTHSPDLISRFNVDSLRIVELVDGATEIGPVSEADREAINRQLFSGGDLLRIGGLARG